MLPWLIGAVLGTMAFMLFAFTIIFQQFTQPTTVVAPQNTFDQSQIDQMVISAFNNSDVQTALRIYMIGQMRTPEMRDAVVEMAGTPEMTKALTQTMYTPEARDAFLSHMQSAEFRHSFYELLPYILAASFPKEDHSPTITSDPYN
jgi:hypothetical protein